MGGTVFWGVRKKMGGKQRIIRRLSCWWRSCDWAALKGDWEGGNRFRRGSVEDRKAEKVGGVILEV